MELYGVSRGNSSLGTCPLHLGCGDSHHRRCNDVPLGKKREKGVVRLLRKSLPLTTPFFLYLMFVTIAYAQDVDILNFPQALANQTNLPLFACQLICSSIVLFMFLLPLNAVIKKDRTIVNLLVGLPILGVCIAIGWFPVWILLILCLLVAIMYGRKMGDVLG